MCARAAADRAARRCGWHRLARGTSVKWRIALLGCYRYGGLVVVALAHAALGEDGALGDPLEGFFEYLARVRFEHDALAGSPATCIHLIVEARGEFLLVIVRVQIGAQIDVALCPPQRTEKLSHVVGGRIARNQRGDHERAVDDLAESQLLDEVVGTAEQRCSRRLPV